MNERIFRNLFLGKFDSAGEFKGIQISQSEQGFYSITNFKRCDDSVTDQFILVPSKVVKDYEFAFSSPGEDFRKHLKKNPGSFDSIAAKI